MTHGGAGDSGGAHDGDLVLDDEARAALEEFERRARDVPPSDEGFGERADEVVRLFTTLQAALASKLPPCPFAPPGVDVEPDWDPVTHNAILRCKHPGHCWKGDGSYYACP